MSMEMKPWKDGLLANMELSQGNDQERGALFLPQHLARASPPTLSSSEVDQE